MTAPVLFVIYRRHEIARKVFRQIRDARPARLYIAADGPDPTRGDDAEATALTRRTVLDMIDWPCEVKLLMQTGHLVCGRGMFEAIEWFFTHEEMGLIIEEDCLATPSCFTFIESMLLKYAGDERIGMVAGCNPVAGKFTPRTSFIFSNYKTCWGWGTWRRAWKRMDIEMSWRATDERDVLRRLGIPGCDVAEGRFRLREIDRHHVSTWDWEWIFTLALHRQLCIYPTVNLVTNIGDDPDATHTALGGTRIKSNPLTEPFIAPREVAADPVFERLMHAYENSARRQIQRVLPYWVRRCAKKLVLSLRYYTSRTSAARHENAPDKDFCHYRCPQQRPDNSRNAEEHH